MYSFHSLLYRHLFTLSRIDWCYALVLLSGAVFAWYQYQAYMDHYEQAILFISVPVFSVLGWHWKAFRLLLLSVGLCTVISILLYRHDLNQAEQVFLLKYLLSSQSAILWMSLLFFLSTGFYWVGLLARADISNKTATLFCWCAIALGWIGLLVRWYESYLIGLDIGHIPISNLYEVFVLFCLITAMFCLYYQQRYATQALGAFVLPIIAIAIVFLLWYIAIRNAQQIQPLVPSLQSWWLKIHVPANFIGYGTFALAAMVAIAYLLKQHHLFDSRLPSLSALDDLMYRAITVGFTFFTLATILGALWAAEAWGGYWSWDPKETWSLILWLNYAAWLHMRLIKGLRGSIAAWWALLGLSITAFTFLGVNLFLSGLHSYGQL